MLRGNVEQVNLLVNSNRIDIHAQDKGGYTALMWAGLSGRAKAVGALLRKFSFMEDTADEFHTANAVALKYGHHDIIKIMDETPFGLHAMRQEAIDIIEEDISLSISDAHFGQMGEVRSSIKVQKQKTELENRRIDLLKIMPDYSINNGAMYFRSKTLNETMFIELSVSGRGLIRSALSGPKDLSGLEQTLELLKSLQL